MLTVINFVMTLRAAHIGVKISVFYNFMTVLNSIDFLICLHPEMLIFVNFVTPDSCPYRRGYQWTGGYAGCAVERFCPRSIPIPGEAAIGPRTMVLPAHV